MDVFEAIKNRHSTRAFSDRPVEKEKLEKIMEAAVNAPSGMNRQSWHFVVVTNREWLKKLDERIYSLADDSRKAVMRERNGDKPFSTRYHSPVLIITSADPSVPTSADDCACALENIFLAAEALGLSSCWINQMKSGYEDLKDLALEAGVPKGNRVYGCAAIGYAEKEGFKKPARKDGTVTYFE